MNKVVLDLTLCEEGMSCEEFTTLMVSSLQRKDMSLAVQNRIDQHERACSYHQSRAFHQSAVNTPITEAIDQSARNIVKKYSEEV